MIEAALIMFICVSAIHMGLTDAIKKAVRFDVPVIGCVKCLTFWCILTYAIVSRWKVIQAVAVAFLLSYAAMWLDLLMGYIDTLYLNAYEHINNSQDSSIATQTDAAAEKNDLP